jgi:hypothetical protein
LSDFFVLGDTVFLKSKGLTCREPVSGLKIHSLDTWFLYCNQAMKFEKLRAKIGDSYLSDSLVFTYDSPSDLGEFITKVKMGARLENSVVFARDLAHFAPMLRPYEDHCQLSGNFRGTVNRFRIKDLDLHFGTQTRLKGNVRMEGLPQIEGTFISFDLDSSQIAASDLLPYLPKDMYPTAEKFGLIRFRARFQGFTNKFITNGYFSSKLGKMYADVDLALKERSADTYYKGHLSTEAFHVGELAFMPQLLQLIDMDGEIEGQGLAVENAHFKLKAKVSRIGVQGYDYQHIQVNGALSKQRFKGTFSIADTNLIASADGEINLRNKRNLFDIKGNIEKADFKALRLSPVSFTLKSKFNLDFEGLDPDKIVGQIVLQGTELGYQNRFLGIDSLYAESRRDTSGQRYLHLNSDFVQADAYGNFEFTSLATDLQRFSQEILLGLRNNKKALQEYYQSKSKTAPNSYKMEYTVQLKHIEPLLNLFIPGLYVSQGTRLEGHFSSGKNYILDFNTKVDSLQFDGYKLYQSALEFNASKRYSDPGILATFFAASQRQDLAGSFDTEKFQLTATWFENKIQFISRIAQTGTSNQANLAGGVQFYEDRTEIRFQPSKIKVLDKDWKIDKENRITLRSDPAGDIVFQHLILSHQFHSLALDGEISQDSAKTLHIDIKDFDVDFLSPLTGMKMKGIANGQAQLRNLYQNPFIESQLDIEELVIEKFLIGNIEAKAVWDQQQQKLQLNASVIRYDEDVLIAFGTFDPKAKENALDVSIALENTDLEILEPFTAGQISKLGGKAKGILRLSGSPSEPVLKGSVLVRNGRFRYNYLNTTYTFNDRIYFSENEIGFKNLKLYDDNRNNATLKGGIAHDHFRNFVIDLKASMRFFKVLNTTQKDNSLFYGIAIVSGDFSVLGPFDKLVIEATARSNKGTHIAIPISSTSEVGSKDYIRFVGKGIKKDSAASAELKPDLSGVRLDFNLDITPDAFCQIIFDNKTGDIIQGTGTGKIKMLVDTQGDFQMFGDYAIEQGGYNFTFLNIASKEFGVRKGSHITWNGDPYSAILDLNATYQVRTSLAPIMNLTQEEQLNPEYRRLYPVVVLLGLKGGLMSPQISFGLEFPEYPRGGGTNPFSTAILDFSDRIRRDEQELNRQVFSLIALNKLQSIGSFAGSASVASTLSEFISNQLSYWLSQVDNNLEIDVNMIGNAETSFNTQIQTSYNLGRLRITRNDNLGSNANTATQSIIGEWRVEYWLSKDGRLKIKMYNRNTQQNFSNGINTSATTVAGFSLIHTESFNSIKDLFKHKKNKEEDKTAEEPAPEEKKKDEKKNSTQPLSNNKRPRRSDDQEE